MNAPEAPAILEELLEHLERLAGTGDEIQVEIDTIARRWQEFASPNGRPSCEELRRHAHADITWTLQAIGLLLDGVYGLRLAAGETVSIDEPKGRT